MKVERGSTAELHGQPGQEQTLGEMAEAHSDKKKEATWLVSRKEELKGAVGSREPGMEPLQAQGGHPSHCVSRALLAPSASDYCSPRSPVPHCSGSAILQKGNKAGE